MFFTDPNVIAVFNSVADWVLLTALPGIALFIGFYAKKSPWKKMLVGRTMMYLAVSLGLLFIVNTLSIWIGTDYPGRAFVRVAAYLLLSGTVWRLFFTLRRVQKEGDEDHKVSKAKGTAILPASKVDEDTHPKPPTS